MKFNFGSPFKGTLPKSSRSLLPPGYAVNADNCNLHSGEIRAFGGTSLIKVLNPGATAPDEVLTIFLYDGAYWLNWTKEINVVKGPIQDDTRKRLYWTGDAAYPEKGDFDTITNTGDPNGPLPNGSFKMGVPSPTTAPTLAVSSAGSSATLEDRTYVYTFVSAWGEESAPSLPKTITGVRVDDEITVSSMETAPGSPYNMTGGWIRIYRTQFGGVSGVNPYLLVNQTDVSIDTTSYVDSIAAIDLGEVIPTFFVDAATGAIVTWDEPPTTLKGLKTYAGGVFAAFSGNTLYFSEPYQPQAWPVAYTRVLEYEIVAVGTIGNVLIVATKGYPYIFQGTHPLLLSQERLRVSQPCVNSRSLVEVGLGVGYASPDGFFLVGPGKSLMLTGIALTRKEWQAFAPTSMHAVVHDNRVHIFYRTPGGIEQTLIIEPTEDDFYLIPSTLYSTAALSEVETDVLYLIASGNVVQWDNDDNNRLQFDWRSRTHETIPFAPGGAAVKADYDGGLSETDIATFQANRAAAQVANAVVFAGTQGPGAMNGAAVNTFELNGDGTATLPAVPSDSLQFTYYGDNTLILTKILASAEPFALPDKGMFRKHEVRVVGDLPVRDILLGGSKSELG